MCPRSGVGADDGDGARLEERTQRRGGRELRTPTARRLELRRRLEVERDMEHALLEPLRQREPGLQEHVHHREVVAEHVGVEGAHAAVAADFGEALQHAGAEPVPLQGVGDGKRDFGALGLRRGAIVAGDAAQRLAALGDDDHLPESGAAMRRASARSMRGTVMKR